MLKNETLIIYGTGLSVTNERWKMSIGNSNLSIEKEMTMLKCKNKHVQRQKTENKQKLTSKSDG